MIGLKNIESKKMTWLKICDHKSLVSRSGTAWQGRGGQSYKTHSACKTQLFKIIVVKNITLVKQNFF